MKPQRERAERSAEVGTARRRAARRGRRAACAAAAALIVGCAAEPDRGWSSASVYPEEVRSIAVPIFENKTLERDLEFELTDALVKEIQSRTPYRVTSGSRADSILTGRIRSVTRDELSKSRLTGLSEEVIVSVTIDFQWRDLRTGEPIVERETFAGHGLFVPSEPSGESIELGRFAAVQQLAADIVAEMRHRW
jgi:hypothetical protein